MTKYKAKFAVIGRQHAWNARSLSALTRQDFEGGVKPNYSVIIYLRWRLQRGLLTSRAGGGAVRRHVSQFPVKLRIETGRNFTITSQGIGVSS